MYGSRLSLSITPAHKRSLAKAARKLRITVSAFVAFLVDHHELVADGIVRTQIVDRDAYDRRLFGAIQS